MSGNFRDVGSQPRSNLLILCKTQTQVHLRETCVDTDFSACLQVCNCIYTNSFDVVSYKKKHIPLSSVDTILSYLAHVARERSSLIRSGNEIRCS
jgi:hypothetical protein